MNVISSLRRCLASANARSAHMITNSPFHNSAFEFNAVPGICSAVRATACASAAPAPPEAHAQAVLPSNSVEAKQLLKDMTFEELEMWCVSMGERHVPSSIHNRAACPRSFLYHETLVCCESYFLSVFLPCSPDEACLVLQTCSSDAYLEVAVRRWAVDQTIL